MAVTKILPIKNSLEQAINYICNPHKTDETILIHSENCFYKTASVEFDFYLKQSKLNGGRELDENEVIGRHLIQSFAPNETTPEQAHEIGKKFAQEHLKGEYAYVLSTHIDKNHIHNHFVFCAVNLKTNMKYVSNKKSYKQIQNISDKFCNEYGLSVITEKSGVNGLSYYENVMSQRGKSFKERLKLSIDYAIEISKNEEEFLMHMRNMEYEIKFGKHIAFKHSTSERFTRAKTIGEDYTYERIKERIYNPTVQYTSILDKGLSVVKRERSLKKYIDITQDKFVKNVGLNYWARKQNLHTMVDTLNLMYDKGIKNLSDFEKVYNDLSAEQSNKIKEVKELEKEIKDLTEIKSQLEILKENKEIYTEYKNSNKLMQKTKYKKFSANIQAYESASKKLKEFKDKNPNVKMNSLDKLIEEKDKKRCNAYEEYMAKTEEIEEYKEISQNMQSFFKGDDLADKYKAITHSKTQEKQKTSVLGKINDNKEIIKNQNKNKNKGDFNIDR